MRLLTEFAQQGKHRLRKEGKRWLPSRGFEKDIIALGHFGKNELGWSEGTTHLYDYWIRRFIASRQALCTLRGWGAIRPQDVYDFLSTLSANRPAPARPTALLALGFLRSVFRTLFVMGKIPYPLHEDLPPSRQGGRRRAPPLWSADELHRLFEAMDSASADGLRDRAILLLACLLGLRSSDICVLCWENVDWKAERIVFCQRKNATRLILPLLPDIRDALLEYRDYGRPVSEHPEIFLCHRAPYNPYRRNCNFSELINRYSKIAGIERKPGRGIHAFRHTLASRLLKNGLSVPLIANCLGHNGLGSVSNYLQVDLELLREVALDPEREVAHD